MKNNLIYWVIILCALFITQTITVQAKEAKIGSPYPKIWGYDLSDFPAVKYGNSTICAYRMDNGDIGFLVTYSYDTIESMDSEEQNANFKYKFINFFQGDQKVLSEEAKNKLLANLQKKAIPSVCQKNIPIKFSDHSTLQFCFGDHDRKEFVPDFFANYFLKTSTHGEIDKYAILGASSQVKIQVDPNASKDNWVPFLYKKLYSFKQIIPLEDDTFIAFDPAQNLILRFTKNLKTEFKPITVVYVQGEYIRRNFFVIDYERIKQMDTHFALNFTTSYPDLPMPICFRYQKTHDALLDYFNTQYGEQ